MPLFISLLLYNQLTAQQGEWQIRASGGAVYNLPTSLNIIQQQAAPIKLTARYRTDPFKSPYYYDFMIGRISGEHGFALKFTHHKLILKNTGNDIQSFSITDGFNLLTVNRVFARKTFDWSIGGGIVITHPESVIRNQPFPENKGILKSGYYISGPTVEMAISKKHYIFKKIFLSAEGRITGSYVEVPVTNGEASLPNVAFHLLGGIGYSFAGKD